ENFSIGASLKFIYSDLTGSIAVQNSQGSGNRAGISAAGDIGVYYTKDIMAGGNNSNLSLGANLSDVGPKLTYTTLESANFIPTNLRLGAAYTIEVDAFNKFTFALDANKWLVPSPPVYARDSSGRW